MLRACAVKIAAISRMEDDGDESRKKKDEREGLTEDDWTVRGMISEIRDCRRRKCTTEEVYD